MRKLSTPMAEALGFVARYGYLPASARSNTVSALWSAFLVSSSDPSVGGTGVQLNETGWSALVETSPAATRELIEDRHELALATQPRVDMPAASPTLTAMPAATLAVLAHIHAYRTWTGHRDRRSALLNTTWVSEAADTRPLITPAGYRAMRDSGWPAVPVSSTEDIDANASTVALPVHRLSATVARCVCDQELYLSVAAQAAGGATESGEGDWTHGDGSTLCSDTALDAATDALREDDAFVAVLTAEKPANAPNTALRPYTSPTVGDSVYDAASGQHGTVHRVVSPSTVRVRWDGKGGRHLVSVSALTFVATAEALGLWDGSAQTQSFMDAIRTEIRNTLGTDSDSGDETFRPTGGCTQ